MRNVKGWGRLKRRLDKIPKAVRKATQPAITAAAEDVAATIKAFAPVDDGDLRDSIAVTPGGGRSPPHSYPGGAVSVPENAALITAGNTKVRYAHIVEYGSHDLPAQPFFWPGVRLTQKRAMRKIKRGITKAVKDTKNGN